jgi:hypothetical protein
VGSVGFLTTGSVGVGAGSASGVGGIAVALPASLGSRPSLGSRVRRGSRRGTGCWALVGGMGATVAMATGAVGAEVAAATDDDFDDIIYKTQTTDIRYARIHINKISHTIQIPSTRYFVRLVYS